MANGTHNSLRQGFSFSVVMVGVLAVLVPLLAFLQYRWIGEVGEFERDQLQQALNRSNGRFVADIQREFSRIAREFRSFRPNETDEPLEARLAEDYQDWLADSQQPDLIESIYVVGYTNEEGLRWWLFDPEAGTLAEADARIGREEFRLWSARRGGDDTSKLVFTDAAEGNDLWFIIPRGLGRPWVLVEIDSDFLWSQLVPNLVAAHFDEVDYNVLLFDPYTETVLYRSKPDLTPADFAEPDSTSYVFRTQDPRNARGRGGRGGPEFEGRPIVQVRLLGPYSRGNFDVLGGGFQLLAQHQAGSLESAVSQLRLRNVAVGFGILALLATTGAMIIIWAERVRSIGRLQMEFAAGISHELRTPLATIRTAAHNIAAGIVKQPEQIREYAGIVQTEGRRLSAMVDQVIQFAQTEAGRRSYDLKPTDVGDVIAQATAVEEAEGRVETRIDEDLPPALADATALTHCLANLLANALKFGDESQPIRVEARWDPHADRIRISVENGGQGIDASDLPHLFEPFYRGHNVGHVPGSGLGLSLVQRMIERQKGRVTVESEPEGGAVFTLDIPAAKPERHPGQEPPGEG